MGKFRSTGGRDARVPHFGDSGKPTNKRTHTRHRHVTLFRSEDFPDVQGAETLGGEVHAAQSDIFKSKQYCSKSDVCSSAVHRTLVRYLVPFASLTRHLTLPMPLPHCAILDMM